MRRRGRPGLIGTAARTAVIAGTATKVNQSMTRSAQAKAQDAADAEAFRLQQAAAAQVAAAQATAAPPPVAAAPPPVPAAPSGEDLIERLTQLSSLHSAGALTDAEFAAAKAKLLG